MAYYRDGILSTGPVNFDILGSLMNRAEMRESYLSLLIQVTSSIQSRPYLCLTREYSQSDSPDEPPTPTQSVLLFP